MMRRIDHQGVAAAALALSCTWAMADVAPGSNAVPPVRSNVPEREAVTPPGAEITLEAKKTTIFPLEPLVVSGEISHRGTQPLRLPGRWSTHVRIQVWFEEKTIWKDLDRWWEPSVLLPPLPPVTLSPGEALPWVATQHTFEPQHLEPLFRDGDTVLLRAAFLSEEPRVVMASVPVTLRVGRLRGDEATAARELVQHRLVFALLPEEIGIERVPSVAKEIEAFVSAHPRSVYSDYLRAFYVAQHARSRSEFSPDTAMRYRRLLKKTPWLLDRGKNEP